MKERARNKGALPRAIKVTNDLVHAVEIRSGFSSTAAICPRIGPRNFITDRNAAFYTSSSLFFFFCSSVSLAGCSRSGFYNIYAIYTKKKKKKCSDCASRERTCCATLLGSYNHCARVAHSKYRIRERIFAPRNAIPAIGERCSPLCNRFARGPLHYSHGWRFASTFNEEIASAWNCGIERRHQLSSRLKAEDKLASVSFFPGCAHTLTGATDAWLKINLQERARKRLVRPGGGWPAAAP